MTTIAADFRAGVMVSDSRAADAVTWMPVTKVHRIDGELVGCAGDLKDIAVWLKWAKAGKKGQSPKIADFSAILLRHDGVYDITEDGHVQLVERGFHAVGSGAHAAIAALILGHDCKTAVETACLVDAQSGGDICMFNLKEA
jgi:ATP-dependent protease HslVU (ClpYQ) peptidase subunit